MEMIFPLALYIGIPVMLILPFIGFKKRDRYRKGNRVANTELIENTKLYNKLMRRYKIFGGITLFALFCVIGLCFILLGRPAKLENRKQDIHNRDIFLCMDVSSSVDDLNLDMCKELKALVKGLEGERIGISIFNAKSVLLVPLTTDYEYVLDILDELEKSLEESLKISNYYYNGGYLSMSDFDYAAYNYKYEGTLSNSASSLIGDGLASCMFSFPDLRDNPDRTRIIIFTTDNELNGVPLVTMEEAADLCKKYGVMVYAISPEHVADEEHFKAYIEKTGGKYYRSTSREMSKKLINEIEKTDASVLTVTRTYIYDHPGTVFAALLAATGIYIFMCKRMKL